MPSGQLPTAPFHLLCASSHLCLVRAGRASGPSSRWCHLNKTGSRYLASIPRGSIWSCWVNNSPQAKFNSPSELRGAVRAQPVPHCCSPGSQTHRLASPPPQRLLQRCPEPPQQRVALSARGRPARAAAQVPAGLGSVSANPAAAIKIPPPFLFHPLGTPREHILSSSSDVHPSSA